MATENKNPPQNPTADTASDVHLLQKGEQINENLGRPPETGKPMLATDEATRAYWLTRVEEDGVDLVLTELHNEVGKLEPKIFDGGFNKARFERVQSLRFMARELWNVKLRQQTAQAYGDEAASKSFGKLAKKV